MLERRLDGFRLCIYADKSKPQNILESYTFSFTYTNNTNDARRKLVGMGLPNLGNYAVTVEGARASFEQFVRRLHDFEQFLPRLPSQSQANTCFRSSTNSDEQGERYLMCHLLCSGAVPIVAHPGFSAPEKCGFFFPQDEDWHRDGQNYGIAHLGSYGYGSLRSCRAQHTANNISVGLVTSFMAARAGPGLNEVYRIPGSMNYCESLSNRFDLGESTHLRPLLVNPLQPITEPVQHEVLSQELQLTDQSGVGCSESQAGDDSAKSSRKRDWDDETSSSHTVSQSCEIFSG